MHIQFENLPSAIQQEILRHLEMDNFREAKRLRDAYQTRPPNKNNPEEDDTDSGSGSSAEQDIPENKNLVSSGTTTYHDTSNT